MNENVCRQLFNIFKSKGKEEPGILQRPAISHKLQMLEDKFNEGTFWYNLN